MGTAFIRFRRSLHTMLLTICNYLSVSTSCLLLTVYLQLHITSMTIDSACSYIHLEVKESSPKDLSNTKFKERFYAKKKNLHSIKTKDQSIRKGLRACISQSSKMYEHVGMADYHHRRRSEERRTTS